MDGFITWEMLASYASFVTVVFLVVEFTKELPAIRNIKTKYYSAIVSFILMMLSNLHGNTFKLWDIVIYLLSSIAISLTANGLSDFNNPVDKSKKEESLKLIDKK